MSKGFWAVIAAIVVIFGAILFLKGNNDDTSGNPNQVTHHVEGANAKNVVLVEYGDYECPVCRAYYPVMKQLAQKYANDIQFQFSNLPLIQIHQNAFAGARAAEAAGLQNKYWQMHDLLYENQSDWIEANNPQSHFERYAKQLGLNVSQFKDDFASKRVNNFINADLKAFNKTGKELATPTFFLNGKQIKPGLSYVSGTQTVDVEASVVTFSKFIDDEIAAQVAKAQAEAQAKAEAAAKAQAAQTNPPAAQTQPQPAQ